MLMCVFCVIKVFPDLLVDPQQILMVTVAASLQEIGYSIQVDQLFYCFIELW